MNEQKKPLVAGRGWTEGPELGGIQEWRLENGLRLLLVPDPSQPSLTVNIVYLVGSRMETRGERGVAHLLEHMLFKGTPSFPEVPRALRDRGARFNGTTWLDRTHYYETLPASPDNLRFALQLEAERMKQVTITPEALETELGVVQNELLRGENSPGRVLFQRVLGTAFQRHGYGHPTIGLMDDLKQMTADRVRRYYETHYVPNRAVLVVAGDIDPQTTLDEVQRLFGSLEACDVPVEETSLLREPPQDGPRQIELRRVTEVSELMAAYHVPAGGHADFAALQLLVHLCSLRPTGRLYQRLVERGLAAAVSCAALSLHDPGVFLASVDVPDPEQLAEAETKLFAVLEEELAEKATEAELERARHEMLKRATLEAADVSRLAVALTEPIALGDWRYYFHQKARYGELTLDDIRRVASTYLVETNRTVGRLVASKRDRKVEIPDRSEHDLLMTSTEQIETPVAGEPFDPSPVSMEQKLHRQQLAERYRLACLQRRSRGGLVTFIARFRLGTPDSLAGQDLPLRLLAEWLPRGTRQRDHLQMQDTLRRMHSWLHAEGFRGGVSFEGQVPRKSLPQMLQLLRELLQEPRWGHEEFAVLRSAALSQLDQMRTQPTAIAQVHLKRRLAEHPPESPFYVPTLEEQRATLRELKPEHCRELHERTLSSEFGEMVLVGPDLEQADVREALQWIDSWSAQESPERLEENAQQNRGASLEIDMPDKSNVGFAAGMNLQLRDSDPDFPALLLSNYVFGGATLVSRLSSEIRGRRGLSYSISSGLTAHPLDLRGRFVIQAMTNPEHRQELLETVREELQRWVDEGLSDEEVTQGKASLLESRRTSRADVKALTNLVITQEFADRRLDFVEQLDQQLASLTPDQVNEAARRWLDPERMVYVVAGDLGRGAES